MDRDVAVCRHVLLLSIAFVSRVMVRRNGSEDDAIVSLDLNSITGSMGRIFVLVVLLVSDRYPIIPAV